MDEFDFIKNIKKKYSLEYVGDDCAVLPKDADNDLLLTTDMLVEGVDFRLDWTNPRLLGNKALAVSLSDIAAMGGKASWAMLALAVPEHLWNSGFLNGFYEGWHELARIHSVDLVGGDISRTHGGLVIDSTVGGVVEKGKGIRRSRASVGDAIFISGSLGGAAAGLRLLQSGRRYSSDATDPEASMLLRQLRPEPRLQLAESLQTGGFATSMIDISDGLSSDLARLCEASGTGARVEAENLPFETGLFDFAGSFDAALELALNGGEDFELLFTADPKKIFDADLEGVTRIGEITGNPDVIELIRDGTITALPPRGYRHF